jgi:zinc transporter ZupT
LLSARVFETGYSSLLESHGFLFLFFSDLILDSGDLGASSGLLVSMTQVALAVLFVLGFVFFFLISERRGLISQPSFLAYLVAIAIGIHAFGEGMIIGNNLAAQIAIEDFSTVLQGLSFVIHKFLEGFTIALFLSPNVQLKNAEDEAA